MAYQIFAVDDDPLILDSISSILGSADADDDGFALKTFADAESCQAELMQQTPDLFLLDVSLPGMDGYELCRQIKAADASRATPVIFVSGQESIEARIAGYDAGGEDFVVKPFAPEELLRKVRVARAETALRKKLREEAESAEQLSNLALASMDESSLVLQFMSRLIGWENERDIAEGLLELMKRYGLDGVVRCRVGGRTYTLSGKGANVPLDESIIEHVQGMGRIFEFRNRGVYNFDQTTLIVNNMPVTDPDFSGRIRDNLAIAAQGSDSRLLAIEVAEANQKNQQGIVEALDGLGMTLANARDALRMSGMKVSKLILELDEQLAKTFVHLGLTVGQEREIEDLVKYFMAQLAEMRDQDNLVLEPLDSISKQLSGLQRGG